MMKLSSAARIDLMVHKLCALIVQLPKREQEQVASALMFCVLWTPEEREAYLAQLADHR